ncbi:NYN domain-containing protein [Streptomyces sp. NPDC056690]
MEWLEGVNDPATAPGGVARRFLVRNVYLNPSTFSHYRAVFTRSGFRAIDCPPLTARNKNSADIHMVLDIMDALVNPTRYDEFVILSGDADFTPVLRRLREQDRWTTVVTPGLSAAAYRSNCDTLVTPEHLAAAVRGDVYEGGETSLDYVPRPYMASPRGSTDKQPQAHQTADAGAIAEAIRVAVRASDRPLTSAAAAQAALAVDSTVANTWCGAESFGNFVKLHVPDLQYQPSPPGHILDPARHAASDISERTWTELDPLLQRVSTVTGAPALTADSYRTLFEALADDLRQQPFYLFPTSKRVRDQTEVRGTPVARGPVNFVIRGLKSAGQPLNDSVTAEELAAAWTQSVFALCENAQMRLSDDDRQAIRGWLTQGDG